MKKVFAGVCLLSVAAALWAGGTEFFMNDSRGSFQSGTLRDVQVSPEGVLSLAGKTEELVHQKDVLFWCLAADDGKAVYAGTTEGKVLQIRPGPVRTLAELPKVGVFSLVWHKGALYAGTGPAGVIYRVGLEPKSKPEKFCETKEDYVWTLLPDGKGNLLAGTGPNGKLLRIDPDGKKTELLDSPQPHVLSVVADPKGTIFACTDGKGLLYRIDPDGSTRVVYDAAESEIRCLSLDEAGNLYFGTADVKTASSRPAPRPSPAKAGGGKGKGGPGKVADGARTTVRARPGGLGTSIMATNAIYRMDTTGMVLKLASLEKLMVLALKWTPDGLYFGTGNSGQLGRIDDDDFELTWIKEELESQALSLLRTSSGELLIGTAGEGRVLALGPGFATEGTFLSEVFDAGFISKFGVISWHARSPRGTGVEIVTRTGNVEEVDDSWSDFSKPCENREGSDVANPPARFIQYRVTMTSKASEATPEVEEVRISYLAANQAPRITKLEVDGANIGNKKKSGKPSGSGRSGGTTGSAKRTIVWKAKDPDGDKLTFTVSFRAADEKLWKTLKEDVKETRLAWETEAVPDGHYRTRVVVTDAPSNPGERAMTAERISSLVLVDNTRPVVKPLVVKRTGKGAVEVTTTATDAASRLVSAAYSVDAKTWQPLNSTDGLLDEKSESFRFRLTDLKPGEHTVTVRVVDEAGNTAAAKTVIK